MSKTAESVSPKHPDKLCDQKGIIDKLSLRDVKYEETAKWGHFGNGFQWDIPNITNG